MEERMGFVVRAEGRLTRGEEESLSTPGVGGLRTEVAPQVAASCCTRPRRCPRNLELCPGGCHCGWARENLIKESSVFPSSARCDCEASVCPSESH